MSWSRVVFGKEIFGLQIWKNRVNWMHQTFIFEESTWKNCWSDKDDKFIFLIADGTAKLAGRDYEISRTRSKAGIYCKEWRSQWRTSRRIGNVSTGRINRWRWSLCRFLVDARRLHLSPSQWTSSSSLRAKVRKYSLFHWKFIWDTRSTHTDLDVMQEIRIDDFWNVDSSRHLSNSWRGFTNITSSKRKPPKG